VKREHGLAYCQSFLDEVALETIQMKSVVTYPSYRTWPWRRHVPRHSSHFSPSPRSGCYGCSNLLPLTSLSPASYSPRTATPAKAPSSVQTLLVRRVSQSCISYIIQISFGDHPKVHAVSVRVSRTLRLRVGRAIWFARCFWIVGFWSRRMYHYISSFLVALRL